MSTPAKAGNCLKFTGSVNGWEEDANYACQVVVWPAGPCEFQFSISQETHREYSTRDDDESLDYTSVFNALKKKYYIRCERVGCVGHLLNEENSVFESLWPAVDTKCLRTSFRRFLHKNFPEALPSEMIHQERGIQRGWRGARQRGRGRRTTTRRPKSTTKVATPKKFSFSDDENFRMLVYGVSGLLGAFLLVQTYLFLLLTSVQANHVLILRQAVEGADDHHIEDEKSQESEVGEDGVKTAKL